MRRDPRNDVAHATQHRLALLGEELARAGLLPPATEGDTGPQAPADDLPEPVVPRDPGRHSRRRRTSYGDRLAASLHDRLPEALQGRVRLGPGHVALLALAAGVALALTGWITMRSSPTVLPMPVARTIQPTTTAAPEDAPTGGSAPPGAAATGSVVVDVTGKVRRPGIATLPTGSRVVDALRKAGGARPGVNLAGLNLARVLVDGEQIVVGVRAPAVASSTAASGPDPAGGPVHLNSATLEQLEELPGVGPVTAQKILDWRTAHGNFGAVDDLLEVAGIGDKTLADIAPHAAL